MAERLSIVVGPELFRFDSLEDWERNTASRHEAASIEPREAIYVDSCGRLLGGGTDFVRADRDGSYPVRVFLQFYVEGEGKDQPTGGL